MIEDISQKLLRQFADSLQELLQADGAAAAGQGPNGATPPGPTSQPSQLDASALVGSVLRDRLRANPLPLVGALALLALVLRRSRRRRRRAD